MGIGANKETFVCLTTFGKKCPICEHRAKRVKDGDAEDDELKALKPSLRNLYVVVPLNSKDYEKKPHIWDISQYLFQDKLNEELEEENEKTLYSLILMKGLLSRFVSARNSLVRISTLPPELILRNVKSHIRKKDLKDVPNLDEILQVLTYNELEQILRV